ncbi:HAD family hydrolase [Candidatus Woesearchaeota archaeon]|nr:MAG: HAD family hydrolase [Candidatus Woesearchaeota archaeon]
MGCEGHIASLLILFLTEKREMKTFIFDLDDTLIWTNIAYNSAHIKFLSFLIDALGPKAPSVVEMSKTFEELDMEAAEKQGFVKERFPRSMQETYKKLCERAGASVDEKNLRRAYEIGLTVFDENCWQKRGLVEGAQETLDFLLSKGDDLVLCTKGDERIQKRKVEVTGLDKWFKQVYVFNNKTYKELLKVSKGRHNPWKVGNSLRSDVVPAIKAGIGVIYIPCETWAFEKVSEVPEGKVLKLEKLSEIKEIYDAL